MTAKPSTIYVFRNENPRIYKIHGVRLAVALAKKAMSRKVRKILVESYTGRVAFLWENTPMEYYPNTRYGSDNSRTKAKLSDDAVKAIRMKWASRSAKQTEIAKEYGVSPSTVNKVIHGVHWGYVK